MNNRKKLTASILAITIFSSGIASTNVATATETDSTQKQYIIATNEITEVEKLVPEDRIEQITEPEGKELPDIVVANLTNQEVKEIKRNHTTIAIEEDIILSGSTEGKKKELTKTEDLNQWYLDAIGIKERETSEHKVKVALLDSGVAFSKDIEVTESINLVDESECNPLFLDASGHGTAIAGVICAKDNGEGITGINPNISLYSAKVLDDKNKAPLSKIIEGIYWGIEQDVDIMNMSFGTTVNSNILHKAITDAYDNDILLVGAAGNSNHQEVQYPAAYEEVIAVGSTNPEGILSDATSLGTELELLAPGEKIMATSRLDYQEVVGGTSIATAQVTGVASLLWQKDPSKSKEFIRDLLKASSKKVETDGQQNAGLIDYEYAKDIYHTFALNYTDSEKSHPNFENTSIPEDYTDETESLVEGLWGSKKHGELINNCGQGNLSTHQFNIIIKAAKDADSINRYYNPTNDVNEDYPASELHGAANYVANLKYLWYLSVFLERSSTGSNPTTMEEVNNKIKNARAAAKEKLVGTTAYDIPEFGHLLDSTGKILRYDYLTTNANERTIPSSRKLKLMACGYALHLLADVYSHRALVPPNTPVHYTSAVISNQFRSSDFQNITTFQNAFSSGSLEYRLIKQYTKTSTDHNGLYIDNPYFYNNRYLNAQTNVNYFLNLMDNEATFDYAMLMPDVYPINSKLSRLKEFVGGAGCDVSLYTSAEWNKYSN